MQYSTYSSLVIRCAEVQKKFRDGYENQFETVRELPITLCVYGRVCFLPLRYSSTSGVDQFSFMAHYTKHSSRLGRAVTLPVQQTWKDWSIGTFDRHPYFVCFSQQMGVTHFSIQRSIVYFNSQTCLDLLTNTPVYASPPWLHQPIVSSPMLWNIDYASTLTGTLFVLAMHQIQTPNCQLHKKKYLPPQQLSLFRFLRRWRESDVRNVMICMDLSAIAIYLPARC